MNRPAKKTMNYLHHKLGYSQKTARKIIWSYAKTKGIEGKEEADFVAIGKIIQENWDSFMDFYGKTAKALFSKSTGHPKGRNNHNNYIHESLQYTSGCTDDF